MEHTELMRSAKKRDRLVYAWLALAGIGALIMIVLIVIHEMTGAYWPVPLVCLSLLVVIIGSVLLLSRAFKRKRSDYEAFQKNTVIISKDSAQELRKTDAFALEKHNGDLKMALQDLVTTPALTRMERMHYIQEWRDYEKAFIQDRYDAPPHRVAKVSRRLPLYEDAGGYIIAACKRKYSSPADDSSSGEDILDFGSHGTWVVNGPNSSYLYCLTEPGDQFYLLKTANGKHIIEAYPLLDWELVPKELPDL